MCGVLGACLLWLSVKVSVTPSGKSKHGRQQPQKQRHWRKETLFSYNKQHIHKYCKVQYVYVIYAEMVNSLNQLHDFFIKTSKNV